MNIILESNPEFIKILKRISGIFLIFLLVINIFLISMNNRLNHSYNRKFFSMVGKVSEYNPRIESELIKSMVAEITDEDVARGVTMLEKYGYNDSSLLNGELIDLNSKIKWETNAAICILFLLCLGAIRNVLKGTYEFIKKLTTSAEKIVEGNYDVMVCSEKEGDISKLSFQFNQMSKRLKRTVKQLTEEKEFLKDMISNISHQLKTPLASLKMFNELLIEGTIDEREVAMDFLKRNSIQIDRMEWLIQSLLKITRLETGVIEIIKSEFNLSKTVQEEVTALIYNANIKKQRLLFNFSSDYILLEHDRRWMGEAIRNIIKNSIDYTGEDGIISVNLEDRESVISIKIKDDGIGIHAKDIPMIFERFYQGKNTHQNNEKRNGTGIGLSLSKVIVEKHGGYIEVESEVGKGSEFIIIFPKR